MVQKENFRGERFLSTVPSLSLYALLRTGDRLVTIKDTSGGTNQLFREFLPRVGVDVAICEIT